MSIQLDLQLATTAIGLPDITQLQLWADAAILPFQDEAEMTIRIVDEPESQQLNSQYRGKHYPTNVLSFTFENPPGLTLPLLGDLVICAPVVAREALEQQKTLHDHWAHMVIHGCLHLLGFDHINDADAEKMETEEVTILQQLGIKNPYLAENE